MLSCASFQIAKNEYRDSYVYRQKVLNIVPTGSQTGRAEISPFLYTPGMIAQ